MSLSRNRPNWSYRLSLTLFYCPEVTAKLCDQILFSFQSRAEGTNNAEADGVPTVRAARGKGGLAGVKHGHCQPGTSHLSYNLFSSQCQCLVPTGAGCASMNCCCWFIFQHNSPEPHLEFPQQQFQACYLTQRMIPRHKERPVPGW